MLLVLFCISFLELKGGFHEGMSGVYAKSGTAKKIESKVKMLFADSYCDIPSILIPPCLQVFVGHGEEGNSNKRT